MVYIKRVTTDDSEVRIATYLSQDLFRQDPHNHSVPILELFRDDYDQAGVSYMVMPFLSLADQPPFDTVGEVLSVALCSDKTDVRTVRELAQYCTVSPSSKAHKSC